MSVSEFKSSPCLLKRFATNKDDFQILDSIIVHTQYSVFIYLFIVKAFEQQVMRYREEVGTENTPENLCIQKKFQKKCFHTMKVQNISTGRIVPSKL